MVRKTLLRALTLAATATGVVHAAEIEIGTELPAITALDQEGKSVDLQKEGGAGFTLVYFYPKADTSGCTKQACSIRDAYTDLSKKGIRVFGVSGDDVASQKAFADKYNLPFRLLADPDAVVTTAFGVPRKGAYAARQAFLFKDGKLVWRDLTASTAEQAADVLAAIDELAKS